MPVYSFQENPNYGDRDAQHVAFRAFLGLAKFRVGPGNWDDGFYHNCDTAGSVAFIDTLFIHYTFQFPRASLDGAGEQHDRIRGVPGGFERFMANYRALRALDLPNLSIGIHSVISVFNVQDASALFDYAFSLEPDAYITEIAEERVELDTVGMAITPGPDAYADVIEQLMQRLRKRRFHGLSRVTEAFRVEYYRLVNRILVEERQVIGCYAGWASAQIHADGTVWPCCVRADAMGNLRDTGYDFGTVWFSDEAKRIRRSIYNRECYCPLANASYTNMLHHPVTLLKIGTRILFG